MKFEELKKGTFYNDKDGIEVLQFEEFRNKEIATFIKWECDPNKGEYIQTIERRYLTKKEVKNLI